MLFHLLTYLLTCYAIELSTDLAGRGEGLSSLMYYYSAGRGRGASYYYSVQGYDSAVVLNGQ